MGDFRDLKAWQEAKSLATLSKSAIAKLPTYERYALGDQWRQASFRRYLDIARSSLHEVEGILELVDALGYLEESELRLIRIKRANCARLVYALLRRIEEAARRT